jgi:hypothetical protein
MGFSDAPFSRDSEHMHIVFELHITSGFVADSFLSPEAQKQAEARVLTRQEAENIGLDGLPEVEGNVRYVLAKASSKSWIERAIDADPNVTGFKFYEVG